MHTYHESLSWHTLLEKSSHASGCICMYDMHVCILGIESLSWNTLLEKRSHAVVLSSGCICMYDMHVCILGIESLSWNTLLEKRSHAVVLSSGSAKIALMTCKSVYACTYVSIYIFIYHDCVCMYVGVHVLVYVCMDTTCVHAQGAQNIHTYIHTYT
jgi:hypothetical protein